MHTSSYTDAQPNRQADLHAYTITTNKLNAVTSLLSELVTMASWYAMVAAAAAGDTAVHTTAAGDATVVEVGESAGVDAEGEVHSCLKHQCATRRW
jgi:hypothetical protein